MFDFIRKGSSAYYLYSYLAGSIHFYRFRHVRCVLIFLGYPRSGSSILGSILDAHKNILIAHEFNMLQYIQQGYTSRQLFYLLAKNSRQFTAKGRISSNYRGTIRGQFNGKARSIFVIGDKKAGATTNIFGNDRDIESRLNNFFPALKFIHIVRNPFDMIASQAYGGNERRLLASAADVWEAINFYTEKFRTIDRLIRKETLDIFSLNYELLLDDPGTIIKQLLNWINVPDYKGYISSCKNHLFNLPHRSRDKVPWTNEQIQEVRLLISNYDFLKGYSFEK